MSAVPVVATATFPDVFILPSGTRLVLRAVERADRERIHALFRRLGEESRYRRFLSPKRELSQPELAYLSDIDHFSHEAIAAVDRRDGSFAGVVRVIRRTDWWEAADMAIEVADDLQHMGIGSCLTARMLERAREIHFTALTATTLRENAAARRLLKRFGFTPIASTGREIEFERELGFTGGTLAA
ncbi:MAG TPA: GNAT family N-acetyltransferase [Solirubrobacteraceae bacterium]